MVRSVSWSCVMCNKSATSLLEVIKLIHICTSWISALGTCLQLGDWFWTSKCILKHILHIMWKIFMLFPHTGLNTTRTYRRLSNPDDNVIRSLTAFPIASPWTALLLESKWVYIRPKRTLFTKEGGVVVREVCGTYVHGNTCAFGKEKRQPRQTRHITPRPDKQDTQHRDQTQRT